MQIMADFELDILFSYFFPCETVIPTPFFLCKVGPKLDCGLGTYFKRPSTTEQVKQSLTAGAFLEPLEKL